MAGLELNNVAKRFGDVAVVQHIDLSVHEGEFVVLLGESGCGKSTTLRMVAGLETVSEGQIRIAGRDVTALPPMSRDIAMVFQNYALYPHMDVAQNMSFALSLAGRPAAEVNAKVAAAAKVLNIEHLLQRKPKELSGGQRQRVAIGRAIVREPKVFLFDEPLSNLDAKLRGHMRAELALLHERLARTTVYVTHDQIEAMTLAERIVIFDKGRIQQVGTPGEVFNRPATLFVAAFIGMPGMNLLPVRFVDDGAGEGGHGLLRGDGFELPAPGWLRDCVVSPEQPLTVGIRPQALRIASGHAPLNLKVDVVEYLGTESQVVGHLASVGHFAVERGARITATVQGDAHGLLHTTVGLTASAEDMHVFDTGSGLSLRA
ncbi:sn-glycerol-3-phosphate ABC transporter ATP-binding protein UgpC [Variovorax sp. H27-G14]|uniref:ABC transporter ATP-binding protein n=1 Tax=Variovorax sp. H27-G14 TaxID=3111914 RepID=UPI0038FCD9EC